MVVTSYFQLKADINFHTEIGKIVIELIWYS